MTSFCEHRLLGNLESPKELDLLNCFGLPGETMRAMSRETSGKTPRPSKLMGLIVELPNLIYNFGKRRGSRRVSRESRPSSLVHIDEQTIYGA
jgi:hypothetical protein